MPRTPIEERYIVTVAGELVFIYDIENAAGVEIARRDLPKLIELINNTVGK
jgi:hypothetical protein